MTRSRSPQALKLLAPSLLFLCAFEACASDSSTPNPFNAPPTLGIAEIYLGIGSIGQGGESGVLACDDTIGVTVALNNWRLEPPGKCDSTPQCGQIRVSLLKGADGSELASTRSAAVGANLDVTKLVGDGTVKDGEYAIQAELIDDTGNVYPIVDGGNNSAQQAFTLRLNDSCVSGAAGAGASGASGEGGAGGVPPFEPGGAGGEPAGAGGALVP